LNNSAPRATLGAVNGFAGTFTNLARAAAPLTAGALIAGGDTTPNRGGADARR
jgi:hypothetical protein